MKFFLGILLLLLLLPQSLAQSEESEWFTHERWSGLDTDDHASILTDSGADEDETFTDFQIGCDNEDPDVLYITMTWTPAGFSPFANKDDKIKLKYRVGQEQTIHDLTWTVQATFAQSVNMVLEDREKIIDFLSRLLSEKKLSIWPVDEDGNKFRSKIYENPRNEDDNPLISTTFDITGIEEAVKPVFDQCNVEMDTLKAAADTQDPNVMTGTLETITNDNEPEPAPHSLANKYLPVAKSPDFAYRFGLQIGMLIGVNAISGSETATLMCEDTSIPTLKDLVQEYFDEEPEENEAKLAYFAAYTMTVVNSQSLLENNSIDCDISTPLSDARSSKGDDEDE